ncbi:MAG: TraR/DksA C4-type zinc finger protein [Steroidobacteraceae bacterium]
MMDKEQVLRWLLQRRDELERRARAVNSDLRREHEPLAADFAEQVTQRENDDVLGALSQSARAELAAIDAARARLARGDYGICIGCGGTIEAQRLEAVPHAALCLRCAGIAEKRSGEASGPVSV